MTFSLGINPRRFLATILLDYEVISATSVHKHILIAHDFIKIIR